VKHDEILAIRLPADLRKSVERERQRMSRAAGAEVKTSAVVRAMIVRCVGGSKSGAKTAAGRS